MKHMKKSMFITTLAMVVVLVVALSTATFAWYTAQTSATVSETTVTSAASNSASLVVDYVAVSNTMASNSVVDLTMAGGTQPAIYNGASAPTAGTTTYTQFTSNFVTYTVNNDGTYASVPEATTVSTITNVKGSNENAVAQTNFYVTNIGNKSAALSATLTINPNYYVSKGVLAVGTDVAGLYKLANDTYTVQPAATTADGTSTYYELKANEFLRVAIFVDDVYKGVWAYGGAKAQYAGSDITSGTAIGGTPAAHSNIAATVASGSPITGLKTLGTQFSNASIKLVAWFEGDVHTNAFSGTGALFSIEFAAENA